MSNVMSGDGAMVSADIEEVMAMNSNTTINPAPTLPIKFRRRRSYKPGLDFRRGQLDRQGRSAGQPSKMSEFQDLAGKSYTYILLTPVS